MNNVQLLRDSEPIRLLETPRSLSVIEYKGLSITLWHIPFAVSKSCKFPVMHSPYDAFSSVNRVQFSLSPPAFVLTPRSPLICFNAVLEEVTSHKYLSIITVQFVFQKNRNAVAPSGSSSSPSDLFLLLLSPLFALINFLKTFLFGSPDQPRGAYNPTAARQDSTSPSQQPK